MKKATCKETTENRYYCSIFDENDNQIGECEVILNELPTHLWLLDDKEKALKKWLQVDEIELIKNEV